MSQRGVADDDAPGADRETAQALDSLRAAARLNAFVTVDEDAIRVGYVAARQRSMHLPAPLDRVLVAVKDNIHVAGLPSTAATPALRHVVPTEDAAAVRRLRAAGAVIAGTTNMHELALGAVSDSNTYGPVRHPLDAGLFVGGSSGGTAAAVAAGTVPAGLGTDTGGSVRVPAALTGICGFRPSTGRYPRTGVVPVSRTRDTIGPMARTVRELMVLDAVLAGLDPVSATPTGPPTLAAVRLGVPRSYFTQDLDPAVSDVFRRALDRLSTCGVQLIEVDVDDIVALAEAPGLGLVAHELPRELDHYARTVAGSDIRRIQARIASPDVAELIEEALATAPPEAPLGARYGELRARRVNLQAAYATLFARGSDALVFPTTPAPARSLAHDARSTTLAGVTVPTFPAYIRNTAPGSLAGIPGTTVPMGSTPNGLPVGLALDGPVALDERLLGVTLAVEAALA